MTRVVELAQMVMGFPGETVKPSAKEEPAMAEIATSMGQDHREHLTSDKGICFLFRV